MLTKLSQKPDKSDFSFIFDDLIRLNFTDKRHEVVDEVRILSQDVLQHLYSLRGHVGDLKAEEALELRGDGL